MSDVAQLENLIHMGHFAEARSRAKEMLEVNGTDLRVKQLYALSLSKSGVPEAAQEYLEGIIKDYPDDAETMGILGGIYKELFKKNQSAKYAVLARDTYDKNFQLTKSYYTGINAASMSMLAGQSRRGKEIAREVLTVLKDPENDFWESATQAEALLLLKERPRAVQAYLHARKLAMTDWGKINSVYNQLWLLKHYLPVPGEVLKAFSPPVVVAFVGHMIDHPERANKRFPPSIEGDIKNALVNALKRLNAKIGFCSLACGGDILFAEAMEEVGGELNIFLPFRQSDFIDVSVRFAGEHWVERFNNIISRHSVTYLTQEAYEGHADLFHLQTSILFGLSVLRSMGNHEDPTLISVLSERDGKRKTGGTRDTVSLWPFPKNHLSINPDVYLSEPPTITTDDSNVAPVASNRPVLFIVCCDLSSEEKLNKMLLDELEGGSLSPIALSVKDNRITAGFRTVVGALEFCETATKIMLKPYQQRVSIRLSIHVGPLRIDPEEVRQPLKGDAIDLAERLHELATPGTIHATGIVAAILALEGKKYSFDYVDTLSTKGDAKALDVFKVHIHQMVR